MQKTASLTMSRALAAALLCLLTCTALRTASAQSVAITSSNPGISTPVTFGLVTINVGAVPVNTPYTITVSGTGFNNDLNALGIASAPYYNPGNYGNPVGPPTYWWATGYGPNAIHTFHVINESSNPAYWVWDCVAIYGGYNGLFNPQNYGPFGPPPTPPNLV